MATTLHALTVPVFLRTFRAMHVWLDKAQQHAEARRFDTAQYLSLKLAPDMLPFTRQIQIATDVAKGCVSRLAGQEVPSWPDTEASFDDLRARLRRAEAHVDSFDAATLEAGAAREIVLPMRRGDPLHFTGFDYVRDWAMPNFYFHATTTYALLRQAGVELGKSDFLGAR